MSETKNLTSLRRKLVARRREFVELQANGPLEQLNGDSIVRIQDAIDAVDRALTDESEEDFRRRTV